MRTISSSFMLLAVMFAVMALGGCSAKEATQPADQGRRKLSGPEIEKLVTGNTLLMEEYNVKAEVEIYANGTLLGIKKNMKDRTRGLWAVEEDKLCMKFRRWGEGDKLCHDVYKDGDGYRQYTSSGIVANRFTVVEGTAHQPLKSVRGRGLKRKAGAAAVEEKNLTTTDQPDVVAAPKSAPTIQEPTVTSYDPQKARKDIRSIYREMSRNCPGCNLPDIDLSGASLIRANLAGANLAGANLKKANLKWANLKGATLVGADLSGTNLAGADLAGADLERADLTGANLTKTNLRGANIEGAIGIDLTGAIR